MDGDNRNQGTQGDPAVWDGDGQGKGTTRAEEKEDQTRGEVYMRTCYSRGLALVHQSPYLRVARDRNTGTRLRGCRGEIDGYSTTVRKYTAGGTSAISRAYSCWCMSHTTVQGGHFRHLIKHDIYLCNSSLKIAPNHMKQSALGSHLEVE